MIKLCIFVGLLMLAHHINADNVYAQREFTVRIEPGAIECFYERAQKNQVIDFEYQVIDGGHGDLDISFELQSPNGHPIVTEYKKSDNIHRFDVNVEGDYRYCFANSFSSFNTKTVFFELIIEWEGEQTDTGKEDEWGKDILDNALPENVLKEQVQAIQETVYKLHDNLAAVQRSLDVRRSNEARDRNLAEQSNFRVGAWSAFQIILMCMVGSIQVYMLRSLFETDPRTNIWKKMTFIK